MCVCAHLHIDFIKKFDIILIKWHILSLCMHHVRYIPYLCRPCRYMHMSKQNHKIINGNTSTNSWKFYPEIRANAPRAPQKKTDAWNAWNAYHLPTITPLSVVFIEKKIRQVKGWSLQLLSFLATSYLEIHVDPEGAECRRYHQFLVKPQKGCVETQGFDLGE